MNNNVRGIGGYNKADASVNKLFAAYENDVVDVTTGTGYGLALSTTNDVEFKTWADHVFLQNYDITPLTFNGTAWSREYVGRSMTSKYMQPFKSRMYLGYCKFTGPQTPLDASSNAIEFPSRVFYSELFQGNALNWGLEWGRNGATYAGDTRFDLTSTGGALIQNFKTNNIKVGDPLFITNGNSQLIDGNPYTVASVESPYRLRLTKELPVTATSLHYWVGRNWFDVGTDNGDYLTWLGENNDTLTAYKRFSLHRYNGTSLQKVKDAPGTTYGRSVVNIGDLSIYFHGSNANTRKTGFYAYNGGSSTLVSRSIQPYIDGIAASYYGSIVGWREGTKYRGYVDTITNGQRNISITKGVMTWDTGGGQWQVDPIADTITASGRWVQSGSEKEYIGTNDSQVMETPSGNSHNGTDISFAVETGVRYPATSNVNNTYTRVKIISRDGKGTQVLYKLFGTPEDDNDQWNSLGEIGHNNQEFDVPTRNNYGSGIDIRFQEVGQKVNTLYIKKVTVFYIPVTSRNV